MPRDRQKRWGSFVQAYCSNLGQVRSKIDQRLEFQTNMIIRRDNCGSDNLIWRCFLRESTVCYEIMLFWQTLPTNQHEEKLSI